MGDPDDPDLVTVLHEGIFRNQRPVPCNDHPDGIDPEIPQERFDGEGTGSCIAAALVRKEDLHSLLRYWVGFMHKYPVPGARRERRFNKNLR